MTLDIKVGNLAHVNRNQEWPDVLRPNRVRLDPRIGSRIKGKIPESAILSVLKKPANFRKNYPYDDGAHVWVYVRGRTNTRLADGRFKIVEGWTAASENGAPFLSLWNSTHGCHDTMGTSLHTHLEIGQQAYVLPRIGLKVREGADPHAKRISGLKTGEVVTIASGPECNSKMVWWQVKLSESESPIGWCSEGNHLEWLLAPLTLE